MKCEWKEGYDGWDLFLSPAPIRTVAIRKKLGMYEWRVGHMLHSGEWIGGSVGSAKVTMEEAKAEAILYARKELQAALSFISE